MDTNITETLHNFNVERAVLSTFIYEPSQLDELDVLPPTALFYHPFHREVYIAINELYDSDQPIDEEFIKLKLLQRGSFDEVNFLDILSSIPLSNVSSYLNLLKELYLKRQLFNLSIEIKSNIDTFENSADFLELIEKKLFEIAISEDSKGFVSIDDALKEASDHIELMMSKEDGLIGIDTGFTKLNALTSGFNKGDLIILAARPSMGKSSFAIEIMLRTTQTGNGVALFSLEMPKDQIALRMLSIESGVPLQKIRTGKINDHQGELINKAKHRLSKRQIVIDDTSTLTMRQIKSKLRRMIANNPGIKLVIIDYLQLISSTTNKDRHIQVAEMSRGLKLLARELNIAIVALSQLNRSLENRADKRPILSDLRESGSIEQDADLILFIYREDVYKQQEEKQKAEEMKKKGIPYQSKKVEQPISDTELIIGKQRNGPLGVVKLHFIKENASFREKFDRKTDSNIEIEFA